MRKPVFLLAMFAVAVWGSFPPASRAIADEDAFQFLGVTPGVTTEKQLLAGTRWGKPKQRRVDDDGSVRLTFRLRAYNQVDVLLRAGVVQTIDVGLSAGLSPATVAAALKLGEPQVNETVPEAAMLGRPIPEDWEGVAYSAGHVLLYTDKTTGKATLLRVFAPTVLSSESVAEIPAPDDAADVEESWSVKEPTQVARRTTRAVAQFFPRYHLSRHPLDDVIANRVLRLYLKSLDPQRMFFTQTDVNAYQSEADRLDDQIKDGDLSLAYQIYRTFLERVDERIALVEQLLETDHDLSIEEEMLTADSAELFPDNEIEIYEIWRKRVKYQLLVHRAAGEDPENAKRLARRVFSNALRSWRRQDGIDLLTRFLNAVAGAFDPHSSFISERAYKDFLISTRQELVGQGAALQLIDGYVEVTNVIPGGPADKDGRLKVGDRILAVGQGEDGPLVDVVGKPLRESVALMRGKKGTVLRERVLPKGEFETQIYQITRDRVDLSQIGSTVLTAEHLPSQGDVKVGFLYLPLFYGDISGETENRRASSDEVKKILEGFKQDGVHLVVLDIRGNTGGTLRESLEMASLFVGTGPTMQAKDGDGTVQSFEAETNDQAVWDGPLVVLINRFTSSGAEIFAAAIQDYRAGILVGESTHGKATVQNITNLGRALFPSENPPPPLGYLKWTTSRNYRVTGGTVQRVGLVPDVEVASVSSVMKVGEATLDYALKSDKIPPAEFTPVDRTIDEKRLERLAERSRERRSSSEYFQKLAENIELARSPQPVSLNEAKFLASRANNESSAESPKLPGIADVEHDAYLTEVLSIGLGYLSTRKILDAEASRKDRRIQETIEQYRLAVDADPENDFAHYKLAWSLATSASRTIRDGRAAVKHARRAHELDGSDKWNYLLCLAIAEAEAGDFDQAKAHLTLALEKAPEKQRRTFSFLRDRFEMRQPYVR